MWIVWRVLINAAALWAATQLVEGISFDGDWRLLFAVAGGRMKTLAHPGDTSELLSRLQHVTPTSTRRWGRMTAHQMLCHLCDSFRAVVGDRKVTSPGMRGGGFIKYIALFAPMQWPH